MSKIIVATGEFAGTEFALEHGELLIGRHADCRLKEIFRSIPGVSRRHACIRWESDYYVLEDLGSRNGTLHNGSRLNVKSRLYPGDQFSLGGIVIHFIQEDSGSTAVRTAAAIPGAVGGHDTNSICSTIHVSRQDTEERIAHEAPRKFKALVGMLASIGDSLNVDTILEQLLAGLFDIFENAEHGFVGVKGDGDGVTPRVVRHRNTSLDQEVRISQTIANRVMSGKEAVLSLDASADERFQHQKSVMAQGMRSLMCTPLVNLSGDCLGVIQLETTDTTPFTHSDLEVLASVTPHAATAMDYARVHADELQRQAFQRELEFARQIQRNFLPSKSPEVNGYRFFSYYQAAQHVGGDYYDYLDLPDGRLGVVVADVAGKGIAAGLVMSKFSGEFKYILSRDGTLNGAVARMNDALLEDSTVMRFITLAAMIIDPRDHRVEIVNAGHTDTLLRSANGSVSAIDEDVKGIPIGMFPGQSYDSKEFQMGPGDTLVVYTDGLSEAMRSDKQIYGVDRIVQRVGCRRTGADEIGLHLLDDVRQFVGNHPQSDDMCLVCVQRTP